MRAISLFLVWLVWAGAAHADVTVGVFLPTTLADGEQRFALGEKLATALGTALGQKATARNFARWADFSDALAHQKLDVAIVDAWIAAEAPESQVTIALASVGGSVRRRWGVVSKNGKSMASAMGKALAMTRGTGNADVSFVTNAIFEGAVVADKSLKPTFAPSVESALKLWSLGNAETALVPLPLAPSDAHVLYQSAPLPIAAVLAMRARAEPVKQAITKMSVPPFDAFTSGGIEEIAQLRRLILNGPPARPPVWAESPPLPLEPRTLVTLSGLSPELPSLVETVQVSKEQPDD
jgi:hypothetical protein